VYGPHNSYADGNVGVSATLNSLLYAGDSNPVAFALFCPTGIDGISATVWIDNVSVALLQPPSTCAANSNEILMNGDFGCDDAADFPSTVLGWEVTTSDSSASIQAIASGDNSAQAVALSCGENMTTADSSARLWQSFNVPSKATYQISFSYFSETVDSGVSNSVYLQWGIGEHSTMTAYSSGGTAVDWEQSTTVVATMEADSLNALAWICLVCRSGVIGISATVWIDDVSVTPAPPTCAATDEVLINSDFQCDDARNFPWIVPGWEVTVIIPNASVQAITPGYGDSAQAVALSCARRRYERG